MTDGNRSDSAIRAAKAGFRFVLPLPELGLDIASLADLLPQLAGLPRDSAVQYLAGVAANLHWYGETSPITQAAAAQVLLDGVALDRARHHIATTGGPFLSYEAVARAVLPVVQFATPGDGDLSPEELLLLRDLMLRVQAKLLESKYVGTDQRDGDPQGWKDEAVLLQYLGATSPAVQSPGGALAFFGSLGSLARSSVSTRSKARHLRELDEALLDSIGLDFIQSRAAALNVLGSVVLTPQARAEIRQPDVRVRVADDVAVPSRILGGVRRLVAAASVSPAPHFEEDMLRAPREAWPDEWRWSPFLDCGDSYICWDVRGLPLVMGPHFARLLRGVLPVKLADRLDGAWNRGVEDALDAKLQPCLPTWTSPERRGAVSGLADSGKRCDRLFVSGDDLFLIEIKNDAVTRSRLSTPTASGLLQWLEERFFGDDGFPQIYEMIEKASPDATVLGRPLRSFRRVWPIVATAVRVPAYVHFTAMIWSIGARHSAAAHEALPNLCPPFLVDFGELAALAAATPVFEAAGNSAGEVVEGFLSEREDRAFLLSQFIARYLGGVPPLVEGIESASAAIEEEGAAWEGLVSHEQRGEALDQDLV